jgi:hypothetical protein
MASSVTACGHGRCHEQFSGLARSGLSPKGGSLRCSGQRACQPVALPKQPLFSFTTALHLPHHLALDRAPSIAFLDCSRIFCAQGEGQIRRFAD